MKRKGICIIVIIPVVIILALIYAFTIKNALEKQAYEKNYLAPFHEVYDILCEKYPFITSLHEEVGAGGCYGMYYIECNLDENFDCFAELVSVQREISVLMKARKSDEWFNGFEGHIEIIAGNRRLRVFYDNGLISNEVWANDVISDDYNVLWNAFPENDEISLDIFLTDYSDKIALEITQKHAERNIVVSPQFGE